MSLSVVPTLKVFWQHLRRHKLMATVIFVAIFAVNVLETLVPVANKMLFDVLLSDMPRPELLAHAMQAIVVVIALWVSSWILFRIAAVVNASFQPIMIAELQQTAFSYLLDNSYRFYSNAFGGALVRKVTRLGRAFEDIADQIQWSLMQIVISLVGTLIIFWLRSPTIAIILAVWTVVFLLVNTAISMWKNKYDTIRAEIDSEATGVLADAISNAVTIQQFTGKQHEDRLFGNVIGRWRRMHTLTWNIGNAIDGVQALLMIIINAVAVIYAVHLYVDGVFTLGDLVLVQTALVLLFNRLWDFGRVIRHLYEGFADAKEMVDILNTPHEVRDKKGAKKLKVKNGTVEFKDVTFAYNADRPIIEGMNMNIAPHEKVAFVGPSGAGKSTLTKLMLRFFDVQQGKILVDGQNIADVTQNSLRDAVALVPQDPILFHRSLMENIRYGRRDATDKEVIAAAKKARADEFVHRLPKGYDTMVGERGVKLSGGERQRVAIARAILKNAPVLILDEATSSLDSESERLIQDALHDLMEKKTVIVIAHRLSTIMAMDRIVVMERGAVTETGTHAELLTNDGTYARLWNIQAGGFLP